MPSHRGAERPQNEPTAILDQDGDAHQMLQFAGPMHLRMSGPMMMNRGMTLEFTRKGIYG